MLSLKGRIPASLLLVVLVVCHIEILIFLIRSRLHATTNADKFFASSAVVVETLRLLVLHLNIASLFAAGTVRVLELEGGLLAWLSRIVVVLRCGVGRLFETTV